MNNNIWAALILVAILGGISLYYVLRQKKVQILVHNYDGRTSFILGNFSVDNFSTTDNSYFYSEPKTSFDFNNKHIEDEFLHNVITNDNYFGAVDYLPEHIYGKENYLFKDGDSFYVLFKNKEGKYTIKPLYSIYTYDNERSFYQFRFVCPLDTVFDNSDITSINHKISSKQFFAFYEALSEEVVKIDYLRNTVYVQAFDIFNSKMTINYPIKIVFKKGTMEVTLHSASELDVIS